MNYLVLYVITRPNIVSPSTELRNIDAFDFDIFPNFPQTENIAVYILSI